MTTSAEIRSQLIDALRLDLVGPRPAEPSHARYRAESLPIAPSKLRAAQRAPRPRPGAHGDKSLPKR